MVTRRNTAADPNAPDITDTPPEQLPGVPADTPAQVNIRYNTRVRERSSTVDANDELRRLAALTADDDDNPPDPLSEFLETYANYVGYNCMVIRLSDPSTRRQHGQMYNRPHFGPPENLGAITFDPNPINFISSLQYINGNSGGNFQIWLTDSAGGRIRDAVLYSVGIADPPRQTQARDGNNPQALTITAPPPHEKSDSERKLEEAKDRLFNTALDRALNPLPAAPATGNGLNPEDAAALFLLNKTDFLGTIFGKFAGLAEQASAGAAKEPGWKDRAIDAGVEIVKSNPAIVERLSNTVERIFARILPDPRLDGPPLPAPPQPYYPAQPAPQPAPAPQAYTVSDPGDIPEAPRPDDDDPEPDPDDIMDTIDELTALLNSTEPLSLDSPAILKLVKRYPLKARMALRLIASQPLDDIVEYIKEQGGPIYESLLDGASGPYLRQRLAEFKTICETAQRQVKEKQQSTTAPAPEPPAPESEPAQ